VTFQRQTEAPSIVFYVHRLKYGTQSMKRRFLGPRRQLHVEPTQAAFWRNVGKGLLTELYIEYHEK
jgi:hypothetical protein